MLSDFFTQPLQEGAFKCMRDYIMGMSNIPEEEHVGKKASVQFELPREKKKTSYAGIVKKGLVSRQKWSE